MQTLSYDLLQSDQSNDRHGCAIAPGLSGAHAAPMRHGSPWTAKSDSLDRVLRDQVTLDPATGAVLTRFNFDQRRLLDRMVGIGGAAHEGHLFGWLKQLLNLCTALGLMTLCLSAVVLWWRRKPEGVHLVLL